MSGMIVNAHTIALIPPITSSADGTGPAAGQRPFMVYTGEVPTSEYIIPIQIHHSRRGQKKGCQHLRSVTREKGKEINSGRLTKCLKAQREKPESSLLDGCSLREMEGMVSVILSPVVELPALHGRHRDWFVLVSHERRFTDTKASNEKRRMELR